MRRESFTAASIAGLSISLCLLVLFCLSPRRVQAASPRMEIRAPASLAKVARQIRGLAEEDFSSSLELTGQIGFQRTIRVVLLAEDDPVAKETPKWVSGYARGDRALIVLFPARVPSYPDRNLGALLHHELTHILVWEASVGRPVPRWFNEGLATVAAREWGLEDRARYAAAVIGHGPKSLRALDRAFSSGGARIPRAYAFSAALIRELRNEYGANITGEILGGIRQGRSFEGAFRGACGKAPEEWASEFFRSQRFWTVWLPFFSSPNTLWLLMSLFALAAMIRHRLGRKARLDALDTEGEGTTGDDGQNFPADLQSLN